MTDQTPIPISSLPAATVLTGAELFPVVQGGITKKALISLIASDSGGGSGGGVFLEHTVVITADQLADIENTPVEVVPAQGAGKAIYPIATLVYFKYVNNTFDASGDDLDYRFPTAVKCTIGSTGFVDQTASQIRSNYFDNLGAPETFYDNIHIVVDSASNWVVDGSKIASIVKNNGGASWAATDTFTIAGGTGGTGIVDTVSAGAIVTCHLTNAGSGYSAGTNIAITATGGSTGTGATVNITIGAPASYLVVTTYYAVSPSITANEPSNSEFLITNGVESFTRNHPNVGVAIFTPGNRSFADIAVIGFTNYHHKQNPSSPDIISLTGGPNFRFIINYPCIINATMGIIGQALQTPFSAEGVITHAADGNEWGSNVLTPSAIGVLTQPPANFNGSTGPVVVAAGDIWDANLNLDPVGPVGAIYSLQQANFGIYVLQVIGKIQTFSITSAGNGYAVGDTIQVDDGYTPAVATVTTINGIGGVTGLSFADLDARGLGYALALYTTTNIDPQIGLGTGLTITVTATY